MGHAIYMKAHKNENNMLVGKLQKKTPVGRSGHIWGKKDQKKKIKNQVILYRIHSGLCDYSNVP